MNSVNDESRKTGAREKPSPRPSPSGRGGQKGSAPEFDYVSRYFAPAFGVDEDPATGSSQCTLAPYWSQKLGKTELSAFQASTRGGTFKLRIDGDRVIIAGQAVMMGRVELRH